MNYSMRLSKRRPCPTNGDRQCLKPLSVVEISDSPCIESTARGQCQNYIETKGISDATSQKDVVVLAVESVTMIREI